MTIRRKTRAIMLLFLAGLVAGCAGIKTALLGEGSDTRSPFEEEKHASLESREDLPQDRYTFEGGEETAFKSTIEDALVEAFRDFFKESGVTVVGVYFPRADWRLWTVDRGPNEDPEISGRSLSVASILRKGDKCIVAYGGLKQNCYTWNERRTVCTGWGDPQAEPAIMMDAEYGPDRVDCALISKR